MIELEYISYICIVIEKLVEVENDISVTLEIVRP